VIQDRACPHCRVARTLLWGGRMNLCIKCHFRWDTGEPEHLRLHDPLAPFDTHEQRRLSVYRRAVAVGFYNESI
jgi:hypothetical protein